MVGIYIPVTDTGTETALASGFVYMYRVDKIKKKVMKQKDEQETCIFRGSTLKLMTMVARSGLAPDDTRRQKISKRKIQAEK